MSKQQKAPRVAISYSHQPPEHAERVRVAAERLANDGVEVEMDTWSVREGDDLHVFMESMVTDKTIDKVLIFSNSSYAEKADARDRGVGTEAQILSAEIYGKAKQDKFIPIVCEYDEEGKACLPVFLRGRLYIDFSSLVREAENHERLLRRIFDKPEHSKPAAGTPPSYITEPTVPPNPVTAKLRSYRDAVIGGKPNARLLLEDLLAAALSAVRQQRIRASKTEPFDETLVRSLEELKPIRDNLIEACELWIRSPDAQTFPHRIIRLLEELRGLGEWPEDTDSWNRSWGENIRLFASETFLYAVALLLRNQEFDLLSPILAAHFVLPWTDKPRDVSAGGFTIFNAYSDVLRARKDRLKLDRISLVADFFHRRATLESVPFSWVQQADLVCFVSSLVLHPVDRAWYPHSLMFTTYQSGPFEIFKRAESRAFYQKFAVVWEGLAADVFKKTLDERFEKSGASRWSLDYRTPEWRQWLNWEKLASRP